ncbi:MAG: hypothetical protein ACRCZE_04715 [Candidatus Altimarinota bacterium]
MSELKKENQKIDLKEVPGDEIDNVLNFFKEKIDEPNFHTGSFSKIDPSKPGWKVKLITTDASMKIQIFPVLNYFKKHKIGFLRVNENAKNQNHYEILVFPEEGCILKQVPKDFCKAIDSMNIFFIEEDEEVVEAKPVEEVIDAIREDIAYIDEFGIVTKDQLEELEMAVDNEGSHDVEIDE